MKKRDHPRLNSILFGEGVINDAVAILLFRSVSMLVLTHNSGPVLESKIMDGDLSDYPDSDIYR